MTYIYVMIGFAALALASPIPKQPPHVVFFSSDRPSNVETVNKTVLGRDLIAATTASGAIQSLPTAISIPHTNTTAQGPASSPSPDQIFFNLPRQSQWGPGDISNIFFGCVATFLGVITIGLTYCLHHRKSSSQLSDESIELEDISVFEPSDGDNTLPLEDFPPTYTSIDASPDSLGEQGTGSPITPQLEG
ncbi:hypothetical protein MMC22_002843 [Lobaria immixta]|nr:hypothetical protein [Lobaria immixta]